MRPTKIALILVTAAALSSCKSLGTGVKQLGVKSSSALSTSSTDADTFSLSLAYRNPTASTDALQRVFSVQGIRNVSAANLVRECGTTGSTCTCEFYSYDSVTQVYTLLASAASSVGISEQNNSFSCVAPASISDANIDANLVKYVKLKRTDNSKATGLLEVKTTLTLSDVLGSGLSTSKVRGIYSYSCTRTFFEGEGVSASQIQCVASQKLGVLYADYNFYTYKSPLDFNSQGGDTAFPSDICGRLEFTKIKCAGRTLDLRYGFYKEQVAPFTVAVTMTRAPEDTSSSIYGYAALPDTAGNCPMGLVKIRPWVAQPASIVQGTLEPLTPSPPSSFINSGNTLNNTVVEEDTPSNFIVSRQKNAVICDAATGSCTGASFAGVTNAQSVAYVSFTPIICAIPEPLLAATGLF